MKESDLMRLIMIELSNDGHFVERIQSGVFQTADGRTVRIGFVGRADLSGHRRGDGRAFYLEVKTDRGRATAQQKRFLDRMRETGAIAGIVRSVDDARALLRGE